MQSRKFVLGATGVGLLAAVAIGAALLGHGTAATVAQVTLIAGIAVLLFVSLISQRRTAREISRLVRHGIQVEASHGSPPAVTESDLVGALRLIQAQYVGRLDRAQATLERAAAELAAPAAHADVLLPGVDREYVAVVEAALASGLSVAVVDDGPVTAAWVEENGWVDKVAISGVADSQGRRV